MQHWRRCFAACAHQGAVIGALLVFAAIAPTATAPAQAPPPAPTAHFYTSLRGVHIAGYQGWFNCPNDGAGNGWTGWFRAGADPRDPTSLAIDLWPDTSELDADELCPTGFHLPSGAPAYLFSDQNPKTVARHFAWMRQYGIDVAAMQRFLTGISREPRRRALDKVLENARAAAEANRRGFFVMYDVSGMNGTSALGLIQRDWTHLVTDLRLTDSPAYVYDRGKPLVAVWGFGFRDRDINPEQAAAIIEYLKGAPVTATVMGGVPASWRNLNADGRWPDSRRNPQWSRIYRSLDIISPWSVGRFGDNAGADAFARLRIGADLAETRRLGIGYIPVVFPGASWHNAPFGKARNAPVDAIPRRCGEFYGRQVADAIRAGAGTLYTAMFDEVNEGTAIFKVVARRAQQPVGADLLPLDAGGCRDAPSDMYLRLAGEATRALRQSR